MSNSIWNKGVSVKQVMASLQIVHPQVSINHKIGMTSWTSLFLARIICQFH